MRNTINNQRARFFTDVNYAVYLVLGIDVTGALNVIEGEQVPYTTLSSVPIPSAFDMAPIAGIVVIQDGSTNLIDGIKPISDNNVLFYSGMGNVVDKNKKGEAGLDSNVLGATGLLGETGFIGSDGITGKQGLIGITGPIGFGVTGAQGSQGLTGINWDIEILFNVLM